MTYFVTYCIRDINDFFTELLPLGWWNQVVCVESYMRMLSIKQKSPERTTSISVSYSQYCEAILQGVCAFMGKIIRYQIWKYSSNNLTFPLIQKPN